jgi:hypothetical protein
MCSSQGFVEEVFRAWRAMAVYVLKSLVVDLVHVGGEKYLDRTHSAV